MSYRTQQNNPDGRRGRALVKSEFKSLDFLHLTRLSKRPILAARGQTAGASWASFREPAFDNAVPALEAGLITTTELAFSPSNTPTMMARGNNFDRISSTPFSDAVIGSVLTRSAAPKCYVAASSCNFSLRSSHQVHRPSTSFSTTMLLPPLRTYSSMATSVTTAAKMTERSLPSTLQGPADSGPTYALNPNGRDPIRAPYPQTSATSASINSPPSASTRSDNVVPKHGWPSLKSDACREQCRTNQARYRQKQREYVSKLESSVAQLREEIPMLEVQRRRFRYDSRQRVWDVVVEYFQLFRHGVKGKAFEHGLTHVGDFVRASKAQQQMMFLRSTMAPNIEFGNARGVDVLMKYWRQMSEYHEDLHFQLTHMEKVSESIVIATAYLSGTITKTTLEYVFPHLMASENVEALSLAVRLLGHKLDYPCSVLFVWDEETSLVVRMETDIDMALPFLKLLGNLTDVSRAIEGAVMTPTFGQYHRQV